MTEREYAEQRVQQKWYELVMAEEQGMPVAGLERFYQAYLRAVDEYNRRVQSEQRLQLATPAQRKKAS